MDFHIAKHLATTFSLCFFLADAADAGKLYKIVDENGKVTFSQYPPEKKSDGEQSSATVETLKVAGSGATPVSRDGKYEMCGSIRLPYRSNHSKSGVTRHLDMVGNKIDNWQDQLKRLEYITAERSRDKLASNRNTSSRYFSQDRQNSQDKNYLQRKSRDQDKMRDLRCAIGWGKDTLSEMSDTHVELKGEKERLTNIRNELEESMLSRCGELPPYDPTDPQATRERSDWYTCSKRLRKEIRTVDNKLRRL